MNTTCKFCVPLTVYYDKSCPLCATEMHALQGLDWRGRLQFVDCSPGTFEDRRAEAEGVTRADMMRRMHVRDPEGKWLTGMDAFEAVYAAAGLKRTARFWGSPLLRPLLARIYPHIARNRQVLSRLGTHHLVDVALRLLSFRERRAAP
jgi:predicted DCC family thiol-disulfide oxidoreductase YuxK